MYIIDINFKEKASELRFQTILEPRQTIVLHYIKLEINKAKLRSQHHHRY